MNINKTRINKMKKQEMLDMLNSVLNIEIDSSIDMDDLRNMVRLYFIEGYTIKDIHDCSEDELQKVYDFHNHECIRIAYSYVAVKMNNKPVELKEFCLEVELNVKGNFYIKAPTLEKAKELIQKQSFLNDELTNQFMTTEYKKFIAEKSQIEIK